LTQPGNQEAVRTEQRGKGNGQRATFYGGEDKGYTDYPVYDEMAPA